jgi:Carboxypeptidase regulatory-like domain
MSSLARRSLAAFWLTALVGAAAAPGRASAPTAFLSGTATANGSPAPSVTVTASGNNMTVKARTGPDGRFRFPPLTLGSYDVEAQRGDLRALLRIDLGATVQ